MRRAERPGAPQGGRVLVVDDEPDIRELLELTLLRMGLGVASVGTIAEAKDELKAARYDLCLTDMRLADGEGLELARRLREAAPGLSIVLISGYFYRDDTEIAEALAAGVVDGFVSKPFQHDAIRTIVRNAHTRP